MITDNVSTIHISQSIIDFMKCYHDIDVLDEMRTMYPELDSSKVIITNEGSNSLPQYK